MLVHGQNGLLKTRDITLPTKVHLVRAMVFPVVMYGCESWTIKESWAPKNWCFLTVLLEKTLESPLTFKDIKSVNPQGNWSWIFIGRTNAEAEMPIFWLTDMKNWCFWTVVLEKTLESPLNCKEIQPDPLTGDQSWVSTGRTDVEAETPILWLPDVNSWLIRKNPDAGKDRRQEKKGVMEDGMVVWHHWLNGHEFEQALGVGDGQGILVCRSPGGHKESDTTERFN